MVGEGEIAAWEGRLESVLKAVRKAAATKPGHRALMVLLFGAWSTFRPRLAEINNAYEALSDREIEDWAELIVDEFDAGAFARGVRADDTAHNVRTAGALVRALERILMDSVPIGWTVSDSSALECSFDGRDGFVVPYPPATAHSPSQDTKLRSSFARRGLLRTRIFPSRLDSGQKVQLIVLPPTPSSSGAADVAGGFFHCLEFDVRDSSHQDEKRFYVAGIKCEDHSRQIAEVLKESSSAPLAALVFPELTMPPEGVSALQKIMIDRALSDGTALEHLPSFVVAGTWHELQSSGKRVNRAELLNWNGRIFGHYRKLFQYSDKEKWGVEDIEPSDTVVIVASPEGTFSIAICYDFCRDGDVNPFDHLEVDVVLIPSCGDEKTFEAHARHAKSIWNSSRTNVLLVQQIDHPSDFLGFALPASGDPKVSQPFVRKSFKSG